jgi:hypothetical protein
LGKASTHLSKGNALKRFSGVEEIGHQRHKLKQHGTSDKDVQCRKREQFQYKSPHPPPSKGCTSGQEGLKMEWEGEHGRKRGIAKQFNTSSTTHSMKKKDNLLTKFPSKVEDVERIPGTKTSVTRRSKQEDFEGKDKWVAGEGQPSLNDKARVYERKEHRMHHKLAGKLHTRSKSDTTTDRAGNKRKDVGELSTPKCGTLHSQGQTGKAYNRREGIQTLSRGQTGSRSLNKDGSQSHVQGQRKNEFLTKDRIQAHAQNRTGSGFFKGVQTLTGGNYASSKSTQHTVASSSRGVMEQGKVSDSIESITIGSQQKTRVIYPSQANKTASISTKNKMDVEGEDKFVKPAPGSCSRRDPPKSQEGIVKPGSTRSLNPPTVYKANKFPLKNFFQGLFQKARNSFDCQ